MNLGSHFAAVKQNVQPMQCRDCNLTFLAEFWGESACDHANNAQMGTAGGIE
jgi:hypothetical protein